MILFSLRFILFLILIAFIIGWLAGCQSTQVQSCTPVPAEMFVSPAVEIGKAWEGMSEADYLEQVVKPAVEAICEREFRLRVACEHQRPCRGDKCPPVNPLCQ